MHITSTTPGGNYQTRNVQSGNGGSSEPTDTVTLNLSPEQLNDRNIQEFIRQMAKNGTPVNLNFAGMGAGPVNSNPAADRAERSAASAADSARQASASADRAAEIERRIKQQTSSSAPPTYSEG
jgi:hypothetical protein